MFNPGQQYCYDNIFADINLRGGSPTGAYSVFDLFTWQGFGYALAYAITANTLNYMLMLVFTLVGFMGIYLFVPSLPFCMKGDIVIFGIDLCFLLPTLKKL